MCARWLPGPSSGGGRRRKTCLGRCKTVYDRRRRLEAVRLARLVEALELAREAAATCGNHQVRALISQAANRASRRTPAAATSQVLTVARELVPNWYDLTYEERCLVVETLVAPVAGQRVGLPEVDQLTNRLD